MLGPQIQQHPDVVRKMMDNGHGLGLHGMTHVEKKFYASPATALKEMKDANAILLKTTGVQTRLIRTPYGSKPYMKDSYRNAMHQGNSGCGIGTWIHWTGSTRRIQSIL